MTAHVYVAPLRTPAPGETQSEQPQHNDILADLHWLLHDKCGWPYLIREPADGEDDTDLWRTCTRPGDHPDDPHGYWIGRDDDELYWCGRCQRVVCTPGCPGEKPGEWVEIGFITDTDITYTPLDEQFRAAMDEPIDEALFTGVIGGFDRDRISYLAEQRITLKITKPDPEVVRLFFGGDFTSVPQPESVKRTLWRQITCFLGIRHDWQYTCEHRDHQRCALCGHTRWIDVELDPETP